MSVDHGVRQVVVVGAGTAGAATAMALRERGFTGAVTLLGEERHRPYDRPPLSKAVLLDAVRQGAAGPPADTVAGAVAGPPAEAADPVEPVDPLRAPHALAAIDVDCDALGIETRFGLPATGLLADRREVVTPEGPVRYDRLVIATGAEPVLLPGTVGLPRVHLLHTLDDAAALRPVLAGRAQVVVVGAGWIGAEFATAAAAAGCRVTVLEAAPLPFAGVLPGFVGEAMGRWYAEAGVRLVTGRRVARAEPTGVVLDDGSRLPAEAVVVGIGARSRTGWLGGSGVALDADGAVLADDRLRTTLPGCYAVGDCASFPSARYGRRLLVHHWDNAVHGPRTAVANLLGADERYDPVPYVWSEQFGRLVQYAGRHADADQVVRRGTPDGPGGPDGSGWSVCWLRDGRLRALLSVGRPRDLTQGRRLIERGVRLDPAAVADPATPLKAAVAADGAEAP